MSKSKHARPDEFQKEQIRNLKKEVIRKDQEIRRLQKELGYSQNKDPNKKRSRREEVELEPNCVECARGFLREISLVGRTFIVCSVCDYRKKI